MNSAFDEIHDDECVTSFEQRVDRLPLSAPKIIMAKALTQQSTSLGFIYLSCEHRPERLQDLFPFD